MKLARLHHPASYAVAFLLLGEIVFPTALRHRLETSEERGRNPRGRRNWDEYVAKTSVRRPGERVVLLVSNSQGRGPEVPVEETYPQLLQARLSRERPGARVRVVNWSFGPDRVPEAILLLARAQDLDPDVLLVVQPPNWFREEDYTYHSRPTPLAMFPSDLVDTAWIYRSRLPPDFVSHYIKPVQAVDAVLARGLPSYRYRDWPVSFFRHELPWLEAFVPERDRAAWFLEGRQRFRTLQEQPRLDPALLGSPWPHPTLLRLFTEAAEPLRAHKVFVFQPHPFAVPPHEAAFLALREYLLAHGWRVWDMMKAVPWPFFLEGNVHFAARGHRIFAERLARRIEPLLGGKSTSLRR
jgi:hypothetical protein